MKRQGITILTPEQAAMRSRWEQLSAAAQLAAKAKRENSDG